MSAGRHVVIGAGSIGSKVARLLAAAGEPVVVVTRSGAGPDAPGIERVRADATDLDRLTGVCQGATAIYNCASPPYHRWPADWPPLAASVLAAAQRTGAVLATTSNLYGYGPCTMPMTERTPLAATSRKGRVRAQMWLDALEAHRDGRARVTEIRAGDFLGDTDQSMIGTRVVPAVLAGRPARVLGDPDAPHSWTYPLDAARLLVTVARERRAWGRAWHVPSPEPVPSRELVARLCRAAGVPLVPVKPLPTWLLRVGAPFSPMLRELTEIAYQTDRPFVMDSSAARAEFGLEPTSWDIILDATIGARRGRRP